MIYFVRDSITGFIKIGRSADPWARLSQMQVGSAGEITLLAIEEGCADRERELHVRFSALRQRGEWFCPGDALLGHIDTLPRASCRPSPVRDFWNGLSHREVAAPTGVSEPMLSLIRAGRRRPSPEAAIKIQEATGRSAIQLVFGHLAARAA